MLHLLTGVYLEVTSLIKSHQTPPASVTEDGAADLHGIVHRRLSPSRRVFTDCSLVIYSNTIVLDSKRQLAQQYRDGDSLASLSSSALNLAGTWSADTQADASYEHIFRSCIPFCTELAFNPTICYKLEQPLLIALLSLVFEADGTGTLPRSLSWTVLDFPLTRLRASRPPSSTSAVISLVGKFSARGRIQRNLWCRFLTLGIRCSHIITRPSTPTHSPPCYQWGTAISTSHHYGRAQLAPPAVILGVVSCLRSDWPSAS